MALQVGTRLGPYEIVGPLGSGGMGEVYRARDTRLERTVAIKTLPAHLSTDPLRKQRFEREAKTISALNHPHICVLHDVGHQDGTDYLVMECVEGETLAKRLEKGPLPLEQVLKYGGQIADALDKAHRGGVVHRDLKPGNIMLTATGAKLLDFGLAKPAAPLSAATITSTSPNSPVTERGTILGTFQYMSPEQIEGKELDGRSDIFSLGAVLYEMLTGQRAFEGKSQLSVASAILEKEPVPITSTKPLTPPALDHAICRCLAKDPEERWQTARDLALELKWLSEKGSRAAAPVGTLAPRNLSERLAWVVASCAIAGLFVTLALTYLSRTTSERRVVFSSILPPEKFSFAENANEWAPAAVSPDGSRLVFGVTGPTGQSTLYVRPLNAIAGQVLAGTEGATYPFWSYDGRFIGFFAGGQLKTIAASAGPAQTLCTVPQGRGGTWNRDGVIVFAASIGGGLSRVSATGGVPASLTKLDTSRQEDSHRWPQFLPDGRHFLYLARTSDRVRSEIRVASLDSAEPVTVVSADGNPAYASGFLLYPRQNVLVAQPFDADHFRVSGEPVTIADPVSANSSVDSSEFSASTNGVLIYAKGSGEGVSELIWRDRSGKVLGKVGEPQGYLSPRLSPDGHKLAVEIAGSSTPAIWVYDLAGGLAQRLTFNQEGRMALWSPDGSKILFTSESGGHVQIFEKAASGAGTEKVVDPSSTDRYATSWSSDGQFVVGYEENAQHTGMQFLVISRGQGDKTVAFLPGVYGLTRFSLPQVAPNGKWIAYQSTESGRAEIYISEFPSGSSKWQVSANGGMDPHWRADSKEFFFVDLSGTLTSAEITDREGVPVVGRFQPLFHVHPVTGPTANYDVSADGKRFLVNSPVLPAVPEPLTLIVNWDAELKEK